MPYTLIYEFIKIFTIFRHNDQLFVKKNLEITILDE